MNVFTSYYKIPASGYFLSIMNAASMFGRIIPGFVGEPLCFLDTVAPDSSNFHLIADKVGRTNTILPFLTLAGFLLFIFPLCTSVGLPSVFSRTMLILRLDLVIQLGGLVPFAIFYGFASGGHVSLQAAIVAQLGPTETVGVRIGNMVAFQALGSVCQPFVGLILGDPQSGYRWWAACAFSGSLVLAGASCLAIGRRFALGGKWIGKI
jgi:MCP family monocarboxylic acid transporter-like MFS transporter 10